MVINSLVIAVRPGPQELGSGKPTFFRGRAPWVCRGSWAPLRSFVIRQVWSKAAKGYFFYLSSWPCLPDFPFFVLGFLCVNDFCSKERRIFCSIPPYLADFPILVVGFVKALSLIHI